jgi:hypothetical protein
MQAGHHFSQLISASRAGDDGVADMVVDIECFVAHQHR